MRNYIAPEIEKVDLENTDVIATSQGTETSIVDDPFGVWEISDDIG